MTFFLLLIAAIMGAIGMVAAMVIPRKGVYAVGALLLVFALLLLVLFLVSFIDATQQLMVLFDVLIFALIGVFLLVENRKKTMEEALGFGIKQDPLQPYPAGVPPGGYLQPDQVPLQPGPYQPAPSPVYGDGPNTSPYDPYAPAAPPQPVSAPLGYPQPNQAPAPYQHPEAYPATVKGPSYAAQPKSATVSCPNCATKIPVDTSARGLSIKCPSCGISGRIS